MQNVAEWSPTKYLITKNGIKASRNPLHVSVTSRLYADLTAKFYNANIPIHVKGHLVDLGCGNVPLFAAYEPMVSKITCVDWLNTLHQNKFIDVSADLNQTLPFENNSFDTIILSDVLEHIAAPEVIWSEMARILKPSGKILISVPFFYRIHEAPYDYYRYTEFALINFAARNNLTVVSLEAIGGFPEVLTDLVAKNIVRIPLLGNPAAKFLQWFCYRFVQSGIGRKLSQKSKSIFPMGYFMVITKN